MVTKTLIMGLWTLLGIVTRSCHQTAIVTWFENLFEISNSIVSSLNQDQNNLIVLTLSFQNKHRHRKTNMWVFNRWSEPKHMNTITFMYYTVNG